MEIDFRDFDLSENIESAIARLGYRKPSAVQARVIPLALKDRDLIVKSQTGSGKTAAFGSLCAKKYIEERLPQVLVLTLQGNYVYR
jgi:superfamily II DNA/RNA helicase